MTMHGRAGEYLEGVLSAADEEAFLDHVIDCAACQAELHGEVQLRDREDALRGAAPKVEAVIADVVPIHRGRRRRAVVIYGVALAAAAAAAALVIALRRPATTGTSPTAPQLALAEKRSIETRLTWPPAAGHRPYDAMRSASELGYERLDRAAVTALTACRDVAAANVLSGELVRAQQEYDRCGAGAELDAERAGLAVLRRDPAAGLELADRALAASPDQPVALWNRALALRDLDLGLAAAAAFDRVAAVDPDWAGEARQRAAAARDPLEAMRDGYQRVVTAGAAMVAGGPPIDAALARQFPARARLRLDDAIRVATTQARLAELRPLAEALEGIAGDGLVDRLAAARPSTAPSPLIARYVEWIAALAISDDAAWRRWLADARAARADALVLGAVLMSGRVGDAPETAATAAATGDPWVIAQHQVLTIAAMQGAQPEAAAIALAELEAACAARTLPEYSCLRVAYQRARLEYDRYRPAEVQTAVAVARPLANATGEWAVRWRLHALAAEAERVRAAGALAIALMEEAALEDGDCRARRYALTVAAEYAFGNHRVADARRIFESLPVCDAVPDLIALGVEADLARAGLVLRPTAALVGDLERTDASAAPPGYVAYLIGRARLGADRDAPAQLRALIAVGEAPLPTGGAPSVTTLATNAVAVEAARTGDWPAAVADVARWVGVASPTRCALVIAADDFRFTAIAVDHRGHLTGAYEADRVIGDGRALPASVIAALRDCPTLDVLATPPALGAELELDPARPWRFVSGPPRPSTGGPVRRLIIADPSPPAWLELPRLDHRVAPPSGAELLRGDAATVGRVAAAARDATVIEIHAHGAKVVSSDAPALALSDGVGGWAATAEVVRGWSLRRAPVVLLANCDAGRSARYEQRGWSLPRSFLAAGARAVVASLVPVPDAEAGAVFAQLGDAIAAGEPVAGAVARTRAEKIAVDPTSWVRHIVVFE